MFIRKSLNPKLDKVLRFKSQPHLKAKPTAQNFQQNAYKKAQRKQVQQKGEKKISKYPNKTEKQKISLSVLRREQLDLYYQQTANSFYKKNEEQTLQRQQNYHNDIQKPIEKNQRQNKKLPISYFNQTIAEKNQNPQKFGLINRHQSQNAIFMRKDVNSLDDKAPLQNYSIKNEREIRLPQISSKYLQTTLSNLYKPLNQRVRVAKANQSLPQKQFTISGTEKQQNLENSNANQVKFHPFSPLKPACVIKNNNFKQMYDLIRTIKTLKSKDNVMKESVVIRKYGKFF